MFGLNKKELSSEIKKSLNHSTLQVEDLEKRLKTVEGKLGIKVK